MDNRYSLHGLSSERLDFRRLEDSDFENWLPFCQHPEALNYIPISPHPDPVKRCEAWFDRVYTRYREKTGGMHVLVDRNSGKMVGQCGLMRSELEEKQVIELGYAILPEYWGKGYAAEAAAFCIETVFAKQWGKEVIALIEEENIASHRVALKIGMLASRQIERDGVLLQVYSFI